MAFDKHGNLVGGKQGICDQLDQELRYWQQCGLSIVQMIGLIRYTTGVSTNERTVKRFFARIGSPLVRYDQSGANNPSWKGGRRIEGGYVYVYAPEHPHAGVHGYVFEHRLVMEKILGRYLLPEEVVHHGVEGTLCNLPHNLTLYANNGAHLSATRKGKKPQWSAEGEARVVQVCRQNADRRRIPSRVVSGIGGDQ